MLKQRVITAAILAPLALSAIIWFPLNWIAVLAAFVVAAGAWEWGPFMGWHSYPRRILYTLLIIALIGAVEVYQPYHSLWATGEIASLYRQILIVAGLWWVSSLVLVVAYPRMSRVWGRHKIFLGVFGVLTLIPTYVGILALRSYQVEQSPFLGAWLVIFVLAMVWAADVGAYFTGRKFGRLKLMASVSPNKTIEGLLGGVAFALLIVFMVTQYMRIDKVTMFLYFVICALTVLFSAIGDLNESMFKRRAGLKDSGRILPGHGGVLDRIDSLTAAFPVFALFFALLIG